MSPGLGGVAINQIFLLTSYFQYSVRCAAEVENLFTSVERVQAYTRLPSEEHRAEEMRLQAGKPAAADSPPQSWPTVGELRFEKLTMQYRPHLKPALKDIDLVVNGGTRVGVVGRTGAGAFLRSLRRVLASLRRHLCCTNVPADLSLTVV